MLRKLAYGVLIIGIIVGAAQSLLIYEKQITERSVNNELKKPCICLAIGCCGECKYTDENNYCVHRYDAYVRGFPLYTKGYALHWKTNAPLGIEHLINFLIFIVPGIALIITERIVHENNKHKRSSKK